MRPRQLAAEPAVGPLDFALGPSVGELGLALGRPVTECTWPADLVVEAVALDRRHGALPGVARRLVLGRSPSVRSRCGPGLSRAART